MLVQRKPKVESRFESYKAYKKKRAPSVLILGLDTLGRINMQRTMPKVFKFLKDNKFYDFKGFNKVGDNTFPNLLAALAGRNIADMGKAHCYPNTFKGFEDCPFIWKDFEKNGYVTAYTEDYRHGSTFNYLKQGFYNEPVDYYGRPGLIMVEDEKLTEWKNLTKARYMAEYVLQHALDFAKLYRGHPSFGLFWSNALTHDLIEWYPLMDDPLLNTLQQVKSNGILDESIVIVMGDHGMRFEPSISLPSGWYDARLPIMFISLPSWFKQEHPDAAKAMEINKDRLVSHYDLYLTLKDILRKSGRLSLNPEPDDTAPSCPNCQTLLKPVPFNRTCNQTGIPDQWCTCQTFKPVQDALLVEEAAEFAVSYINQEVQKKLKVLRLDPKLCLNLKLRKVHRASKSSQIPLLVNFESEPGNAIYEADIKYDRNKDGTVFRVDGSIIRINLYKTHGFCANDIFLKNFCECSEKHPEK